MKDKKNIIRFIAIIIIIILIILTGVFSLSYRINSNNNYKEKLKNIIMNNYSQPDNIEYVNIYSSYYIFTTKDKVYVLDNKYKEVYKENLSKLAKNTNNYDLIYKEKKLMYEKTNINKNKVIYEYYDIKNYKKLSEKILEK